jgi:hypothetical protein
MQSKQLLRKVNDFTYSPQLSSVLGRGPCQYLSLSIRSSLGRLKPSILTRASAEALSAA